MRLSVSTGLAGTASLIASVVVPMMVPHLPPWVGFSLLGAAAVMYAVAIVLSWSTRQTGDIERAITQSTHGPHSPAYAARDNATFVINHAPSTIQAVGSIHGTAHLQPSDEAQHPMVEQIIRNKLLDQEARMDAERRMKFGPPPAPSRDASLGDAFAYWCIGTWGEKLFDVVASGRGRGDPTEQFRQLAFDGKLAVWGRLSRSDIYVPIPTEYWRHHSADFLSAMRPDGIESQGHGNSSDGERYYELMVCRAQVEKEQPFVE